MKTSVRYTLPALLLCMHAVAADTFVESDGFVYFEAEDAQFGGDWVLGLSLIHI